MKASKASTSWETDKSLSKKFVSRCARLRAFAARCDWREGGKYVSHAPRAAVQCAIEELFLNGGREKRYFEIVSEPKKLKIYQTPRALSLRSARTALGTQCQ